MRNAHVHPPKFPCEIPVRPELRARRPCGEGGRRYVVMGISHRVEVNLCSRHADRLRKDFRVYTVEAFAALQPHDTGPEAEKEFKLS